MQKRLDDSQTLQPPEQNTARRKMKLSFGPVIVPATIKITAISMKRLSSVAW